MPRRSDRRRYGRRLRTPVSLVAFVMALAVVAAACGGSSSGSGVASLEGSTTSDTANSADSATDSGELDSEAAFLGLAQCLREEGIDVADPTVDAEGNVDLQGMFEAAQSLEPVDIEAAAAACSDFLEEVVPTFSDFDFTELQDDLLEFAGCMRDNGYDLPDPDFSSFGLPGTDGSSGGPFGEIAVDDPAFEQALQQCQDILAGFTGTGPGGAGS